MAASRDIQVVEKLNTNNYSTWKFKTEVLLAKEELFEVITDDALTLITVEKKDRKDQAIINLTNRRCPNRSGKRA